jgi:hypothetical protein
MWTMMNSLCQEKFSSCAPLGPLLLTMQQLSDALLNRLI